MILSKERTSNKLLFLFLKTDSSYTYREKLQKKKKSELIKLYTIETGTINRLMELAGKTDYLIYIPYLINLDLFSLASHEFFVFYYIWTFNHMFWKEWFAFLAKISTFKYIMIFISNLILLTRQFMIISSKFTQKKMILFIWNIKIFFKFKISFENSIIKCFLGNYGLTNSNPVKTVPTVFVLYFVLSLLLLSLLYQTFHSALYNFFLP